MQYNLCVMFTTLSTGLSYLELMGYCTFFCRNQMLTIDITQNPNADWMKYSFQEENLYWFHKHKKHFCKLKALSAKLKIFALNNGCFWSFKKFFLWTRPTFKVQNHFVLPFEGYIKGILLLTYFRVIC